MGTLGKKYFPLHFCCSNSDRFGLVCESKLWRGVYRQEECPNEHAYVKYFESRFFGSASCLCLHGFCHANGSNANAAFGHSSCDAHGTNAYATERDAHGPNAHATERDANGPDAYASLAGLASRRQEP